MILPGKGEANYFSRDDCEDHSVVATIDHATTKAIKGDNGEKNKIILHFAERNVKPLICNVINQKRIIAVYGNDTDLMKGKRIELYFDPNVEMGGEIVGGVRVRIPPAGEKFPANGQSPLWTFAECKEKTAAVGIPYESLVAELKQRGLTAFSSAKATPIVQELIAAATAPKDEDFDAPVDDGIPF